MLLEFVVKSEDFTAHALVLMDERDVSHADKNDHRNGHKNDDRLRELAPDAEIHFHAPSKPRGGRP